MSLEKGIQKMGAQISAAMAAPPSSGESQFESIKRQIQQFESSLDSDKEVAVRLASFGATITMSVDVIEWDGLVIVFHGWVNENRATLVQNMSQLNFLLLAASRDDPEKPRKKIGFDPNQG